MDSGWYDRAGSHQPSNTNYAAGYLGTDNQGYHNFFVFDLSGITVPIVSAELRIFNPESGYSSPDPSETYVVSDVSTPIPILLAGGSGLSEIFEDLGSGVSYASRPMSADDNGTLVTIGLNAAAVTDLNSARGLFAFGGSVSTLSPRTNVDEAVFVGSLTPARRELVVTLVPEPGTLALLGTGGLGLLGCGWRRRRRVEGSKA